MTFPWLLCLVILFVGSKDFFATKESIYTFSFRSRRPPSGAPYPNKVKETHELIISWFSWLAVNYSRVRTTTTVTATTVESRNMAAMLQIIGWQRHAALVYSVLYG